MAHENRRRTRASTSPETNRAGEWKRGPPTLSEWLASGGGIFVSRVLITPDGERVPGQEPEAPALVLSQSQTNPFSTLVNRDEIIALGLACNMNFYVTDASSPSPPSSQSSPSASNDKGKSTTTASTTLTTTTPTAKRPRPRGPDHTFTYFDIFYLTGPISGFGPLGGPARWTVEVIPDSGSSTGLLVLLSGFSVEIDNRKAGDDSGRGGEEGGGRGGGGGGGKRFHQEELKIPLRFVRESYVRLYADLVGMEGEKAGARKEQERMIRKFGGK